MRDCLPPVQLVVSVLFMLEVLGLFVVHLVAMPMQLLLFIKNKYFLYLIVIAVGSMFGAGLINPSQPAGVWGWLALFQV